MKRRIFISHTKDSRLDEKQLRFKNALIEKIKEDGYIPEIFSISGNAKRLSWSFDNVEKVMSSCCGAIIIAFPRWSFLDKSNVAIKMPSEYSHYEGAIALRDKLPTLIITEDSALRRGITDMGGGLPITFMNEDPNEDYINEQRFKNDYPVWLEDVKNRFDIFLGYCSKSRGVAKEIQLFLQNDLNLKVMDWSKNFNTGESILDQIERASLICSSGIFLFTKDDPLEGNAFNAAPRDNVIFEAGYFINSKGKHRVLIIVEKGAKTPADIGGHIYISLEDKDKINAIETQIRSFIENNF
jgi:hypothetical protein